jgi:hypothetical protein
VIAAPAVPLRAACTAWAPEALSSATPGKPPSTQLAEPVLVNTSGTPIVPAAPWPCPAVTLSLVQRAGPPAVDEVDAVVVALVELDWLVGLVAVVSLGGAAVVGELEGDVVVPVAAWCDDPQPATAAAARAMAARPDRRERITTVVPRRRSRTR